MIHRQLFPVLLAVAMPSLQPQPRLLAGEMPFPLPPQPHSSRMMIQQQLPPPKIPLLAVAVELLHPQFVADKSLISEILR